MITWVQSILVFTFFIDCVFFFFDAVSLTLCVPMNSSCFIHYTWGGTLYILRGNRLFSQNTKCITFLSLRIDFVLANGADPGEMLYHAAFHLGLHCLLKPHSHCADVATVHPDAGQPVYRDSPGNIS